MSVFTINISHLLSKLVFIYISYLLPKDLFITYMGRAMCLPWHTSGYQRTTCRSQFSPFITWVPRIEHMLSYLTASLSPTKPFLASFPYPTGTIFSLLTSYI